MAAQDKDAKGEQTPATKPKVFYPPVPPNYWFEGERATIDTSETDPQLEDDEIAVNFYSAVLHNGHRTYMSKRAAISLANKLLEIAEKQ